MRITLMNMKRIITFSMVLTGFTAMASQIIYMRELLVVFYGNELSISFILASWLAGGAIGSAVFGRFADLPSLRGRNDALVFALCQIMLGLLLIAGIISVKFIKIFLRVNPGEVIGLFLIIVASFAILAPICILMGFMFPLGCRIYASERSGGTRSGPRPRNSIGTVYVLEAVGSIIGGVVTSFVLIRYFSVLHIAAIFACLNFFAAFLLSCMASVIASKKIGTGSFSNSSDKEGKMNPSPFFKLFFKMGVPIFLLVIIVALWTLGGFTQVEKYSLKKQWPGYEVLDTKNSIYGNILITKRGEDYSVFNNGLRLYTITEKPSAEEAVHLALLEHKDPKRVLLIGGGIGGLIEEILKHRVERVDYVELDPSIIEISVKNLPASYYRALKDPRVSIKNMDGRFFVKNAKEKYDCVIVHTGDPYTAQGNRYYTSEFFNEVKKVLKDGGLISFGLTSSESYISKSLAEFLKEIYATLRSVFKEVLVIPGETAYFLASDSAGGLTYDYKILEERTKERSLDTQYVRDYYLFSKLSPEKIAYSEKIIKNSEGAVINRDSRPIAYYYGLIFWTTLFRDSIFSNILRSVTESVIWRSIGIFIILLAAISIIRRRSFKGSVLMAVMTGGFSSMAFQLLILLTFQAMYGYLFYELGIILTAFMAGLALGAIFVVVFSNQVRRTDLSNSNLVRNRIMLIAVQGDFILFSILLGVIFSRSCPEPLFPVLSVIAGSIGGAQFAIANKVLLGRKRDVATVGGLSYGIDLLGSFFGALLTGIFLIPILGISKTCFAVALINLSVLILLLMNVRVEE
jgi:spermidine synthase